MTSHDQDDPIEITPYQAAGGLDGITRLVDECYANMERLPETEVSRTMHPADLTESRKKPTYVPCGRWEDRSCFTNITDRSVSPRAQTFPDRLQRTRRLALVHARTLAVQPDSNELKDHLLAALSIPAERVRQVNMGAI